MISTVDGLRILSRAGTPMVRHASFGLRRGSVTAIIGASGGGKSLIAEAIMGLLPRGFGAEGTLAIGSHRIALSNAEALAALWGRETLLLPQEPRAALDPTLRIGRHLALAGNATSVMDALAHVDLPASMTRAFPFMLSGGMAQRVLVATALDSAAGVVIVDEPTKGLDADRVVHVADLLMNLARRGRAILLISHDMGLVRRLACETLLLHNGRLARIDVSAETPSATCEAEARAWLSADPSWWPPCANCAGGGTVLAAHGLAARYAGGRDLFRDLDIHVAPGGVLGIAGPSGSGKSTLGDVLLGLRAPVAGSVSWCGVDPYRDPRGRARLRRRYQKLHQDPVAAFAPTRTIGRQLADLASLHAPAGDATRRAERLDRLGLASSLLDRFPSEISGGEAQRLALLRLLSLDPAVIVADEPTSRLDPIAQKSVIDLLRATVEHERLGLVLIAHDRTLLAKTADRVVELGASVLGVRSA